MLNDIADNHEDRSNWGIGEPLYQNTGFGFRFDTGQNILLLFNGQRLNAFLPGNRFGGEEYLLENVERLEIIRGPGSALYGANAFTAVVNIISVSALAEGEKPQLKAGGARMFSASGETGHGAWKSKIGEQGFLSGAVRVANETGHDITVRNTLFGNARLKDGIKYAVDGDVFFSHKQFRSYLKISNQKRNTFTGFNGVSPGHDDLALSMYAYSVGADYTHPLSEKVEIKGAAGLHWDNWTEVALIPIFKVNARGDSLVLDGKGQPILDPQFVWRDGQLVNTAFVIDGQGADSRTIEGEAQLTWKYARKNNILLGVNISQDKILNAVRPSEIQIVPFQIGPFRRFNDKANNWLFDLNASRNTFGFYGQIDFDLSRDFTVNLGARLDEYRGAGVLNEAYSEFNPRGGMVYKNKAVGNLKLMYGKATRVPNGFETLSSVTILGTPLNRPERIQTIQALWLKNWSKNVRTEMGFFSSAITNHLVTDANISESMKAQGYIGQFINVGSNVELKSQGIDGKLTLRANDVDAFVNFTQILNTDDGSGNDIGYITKTMINANVNIPANRLNINLGANYRGDFTQPASDGREPVKGYLLVNATLIAQLSATAPVEIKFGARNLFNAKIHYPSSSTSFSEHFPARGIELWSGVSYTFE